MDAVKKNNAAAPDLPSPQCPREPKTDRAHDQMLRKEGQAAACCNAGVPPAVLLLISLACILVGTVRQVRDRPRDLAFLAFAYADLAALFWCLRRAERLPREPSPEVGADEERRRLQLVVWTLSAALSCAFAYRVSLLIMPPVLAVAVWSMTSFVAVVGFFVLVL